MCLETRPKCLEPLLYLNVPRSRKAFSGRKSLLNVLRADNLFESRQSVQCPASFISWQCTSSLMRASRSLLVALIVRKHKVTRGCDLHYFNGIGPKAAVQCRARTQRKSPSNDELQRRQVA